MPTDTVIGECCCGSGAPAATCCTVQPDTAFIELSGLGDALFINSVGLGPCTTVDVSNLNGVYTLTRTGDNTYTGGTDFSGGDPPYGTPIVSISVTCAAGPPSVWTALLTIERYGVGGFDPQYFNGYSYSNYCDPLIIAFTGFLQNNSPNPVSDCATELAANPYWQEMYAGWTAEVYE